MSTNDLAAARYLSHLMCRQSRMLIPLHASKPDRITAEGYLQISAMAAISAFVFSDGSPMVTNDLVTGV